MSSHKLDREAMLAALPPPLRRDPSVAALAEATAEALERRRAEVDSLSIYAHIDELPEELLDILAYDFKVDWWDPNYSVGEKRRMLKNSWRVHRMLGTKGAVEMAIRAIYPEAKVGEWFEYGGTPHHFRVTVTNDGTHNSPNGISDLMALIDPVKRLSSWLEEIFFTTDMGDTALRVGGVMASLSDIPLHEAEESSEFRLGLYAGGVMAPQITIPVPEGRDQHEFVAESRVGVTGSIMVCMAIPEQL